MNTQIVFNIDPKVKAKAMKRAKEQGVSFAFVMRRMVELFADGKLTIGIVNPHNKKKIEL